jgi:EmrB/QacA subfamily drug resistance transporter
MTKPITEMPFDGEDPILPLQYDVDKGVPGGAGGGPSRRLVFGIAAIAIFMTTVDLTIVATALPAIHRDLRASINWAGWSLTIYGLGLIVALPLAGKVGDQFGRRRIFLYSVALFTTSSLLCGFSTDIYMLIVFRALQAFGGGAFSPSAAGLVADHFGKDRDRGIGMFGTVAAAGQLVGPALGGLIVGYLSWRWIFFVNIPIGIALFFLIVKFIPESRLLARAKIDVRGLLLVALFILSLIFAITSLGSGKTNVYDPIFLAPAVFALSMLYMFFRHTNRTESPFIPMELLSGKGFAVLNVENLLFGIVAFGVASLVPLYAEQRYLLPALGAGSLLTARAVGMIAVGTFATFALRRTGYRPPMIVGLVFMAAGTLLMSVAPRWGISPYVWLSISAGVTGIGVGSFNPASRNACLQLAPDQVAVITGLRSMFNNIGIIVSVSVVTAILNRSSDPGLTQAHVFWVVGGIILLLMVPLIYRIPEHKGSW